MRNPFKIHLNHKQIGFNFTKEIPLKLSRTKKKVYQQIELTFNFIKEIHVKITRNKKKINPEIWSQKYPLGSSSWRPFLKKVTVVV